MPVDYSVDLVFILALSGAPKGTWHEKAMEFSSAARFGGWIVSSTAFPTSFP
jgi:hypothetical protein